VYEGSRIIGPGAPTQAVKRVDAPPAIATASAAIPAIRIGAVYGLVPVFAFAPTPHTEPGLHPASTHVEHIPTVQVRMWPTDEHDAVQIATDIGAVVIFLFVVSARFVHLHTHKLGV
jgi:hypothetical protein